MTEELEVSTLAYLPCDSELGDQRPMVVNISKQILISVNGPKMRLSTVRQLNSKVKKTTHTYIDKLKEGFCKHRVLEQLTMLEEGANKGSIKEVREALEILDSHITELMTCAEKQCRMLYKSDYEFS